VLSVDDLQAVVYRGGVVRFRVPAGWTEESDESGGTYYADQPDSGTLRLNVLTFQGPALPPPPDLLRALKDKPNPAELLPSGVAFVSYSEDLEEETERLFVQHWELAQAVAPRHLRLVVFSYTLPKGRAEEPAVREELALLDREIRAAVLSSELGVTAR